MIFVTVGTELAFDRLVRPIDEWARRNNRTDVFAQIGPSTWHPRHIEWTNFLNATECRQRIAQASVVIAHAGMGTILIAGELGKPILVMPRRADLNEHRTDHQLGTVRELAARKSIVPVMDEYELVEMLDDLEHIAVANQLSATAPREFVNKLRNFIAHGVTTGAPATRFPTLKPRPALPFDGGRAIPAPRRAHFSEA